MSTYNITGVCATIRTTGVDETIDIWYLSILHATHWSPPETVEAIPFTGGGLPETVEEEEGTGILKRMPETDGT